MPIKRNNNNLRLIGMAVAELYRRVALLGFQTHGVLKAILMEK